MCMRMWRCASRQSLAFLLEMARSQPTGIISSYGELNPELTDKMLAQGYIQPSVLQLLGS